MGDAGKDELYPIAKALLGKYRVVSSISMDYVMVFKRQNGAFLDVARSTHPFPGSMVGITATKPEWSILAEVLLAGRADPPVLALDVSRFDIDLLQELRRAWVYAVNHWYKIHFDESDDEQTRRSNIMASVLLHVHLFQDMLYAVFGGQSSGNPNTAEENSFIIELMLIVIFSLYLEENDIDADPVTEWRKHYRGAFYGDDSFVTCTEGVYTDFDQIYVTKMALKHFGSVIVTADKGEFMPAFAKFTEATFLKRNFKQVSPGHHMGSLSVKNAVETSLWYRKSAKSSAKKCQIDNANFSLAELMPHGSKIFNHYRRLYLKIAIQEGWRDCEFITYDKTLESYMRSF
jgi:hypothetical protein